MVDITAKNISLRFAVAEGKVFCSKASIDRINNNTVPKGDIFGFARSAGFLASKKTSSLIPHCHPVSVDGLNIAFDTLSNGDANYILIRAEAKSIGRTGVEIEVLTAVSISALTVYDILKPIDTSLEIGNIKLIKKEGGKKQRNLYMKEGIKTAVLVCSDSTSRGQREDKSGIIIKNMLEEAGTVIADYKIIPDEKSLIQRQIKEWVSLGISFIFTTGGTGLGPRDHTVDAVAGIIERDAPGISEAIRSYGGQRTPLAMFSRLVVGSIGKTLVVTLPGSSNGAREGMEVLIPSIFHAKKMLGGGGH